MMVFPGSNPNLNCRILGYFGDCKLTSRRQRIKNPITCPRLVFPTKFAIEIQSNTSLKLSCHNRILPLLETWKIHKAQGGWSSGQRLPMLSN